MKTTHVKQHMRGANLKDDPTLKREEHAETRGQRLVRLFDGNEEERRTALYGVWNDYEREHPQERSGSNELFAKWFLTRFPEEHDLNYALQWVERFHSGTPTTYMDGKSLDIYIEVIKSYHGR